jgi:hypothetical protein
MLATVLLCALATAHQAPPMAEEETDAPVVEEYVEEEPAPPVGLPPVATALASGGAAFGAMALATVVFLVVSLPFQLCPPVGALWSVVSLVGFPLVAAELGVLAAQAVAGKYGKRRVSNLALLAGAVPFACGGFALNAVAAVGMGLAVVAVVVFVPVGLTSALILLGLNVASAVVILGLALAGFAGAAVMVGILSVFTGRALVDGEPDLNWDVRSVPEPAPYEDEEVLPAPGNP